MTPLLPELSALPLAGTFEVSSSRCDDGSPGFPLLCERILMRRSGIPVTFIVFDVLSLDGRAVTHAPYSERRAQREALNLNGVYWQTPETFADGQALFDAVCAHELEGIVAKRRSGRYLPGERGWVKIKNRDYSRYEMERKCALNKRRVKQFV